MCPESHKEEIHDDQQEDLKDEEDDIKLQSNHGNRGSRWKFNYGATCDEAELLNESVETSQSIGESLHFDDSLHYAEEYSSLLVDEDTRAQVCSTASASARDENSLQ